MGAEVVVEGLVSYQKVEEVDCRWWGLASLRLVGSLGLESQGLLLSHPVWEKPKNKIFFQSKKNIATKTLITSNFKALKSKQSWKLIILYHCSRVHQ